MSTGQESRIRVADGDTELEGNLISPLADGPHPAVMLFHGGAGRGPSFDRAVRDIAEHGYIAVGVDMFGIDADLSTPITAGAYFMALLTNPQRLRERVVAWFEAVGAHADVDSSRIAAIGYCFGGKCVLELARSGAAVKCVTSFHGLLETHAPAQPGVVTAKVAVWSGGRDPYVAFEHYDGLRQEFDAAGVDYQATLFAKAQHSFTDPDHEGLQPGIAYDRLSHRVAWAGTLALLDECLG